MPDEFYICPACGDEVRVGSKSCPTCDPPKPWEQVEGHDGLDLDLPEDDTFDYDKFTDREFGHRPSLPWVWVITAILTLLALAAARFFF